MKKLLTLIFALASFAFADKAFLDKASAYISQKTGQKIIATEAYDLKSTPSIKFVILEDSVSKTKIPVFITSDAKMILGLSNVLIPSDSTDLELIQDTYKKIEGIKDPDPKALDKFFSSLKQTRYISLKSENKESKKTIYMVSDPRCPGCRKELGEIENKLKEGDVKILLVAFLGEESATKASVIYEKLIGVKDNAKKLKILREVYDPDYKITPKDKKLSTKAVKQNNEDVAKVGIQGVPFEHTINK
ncbi:hypothetical protein CQA62_01650 [Helicobacter cholecystus]|uniref:Uncharacterized protein n=1 Tax=Helicobacter cholecystus TaxID=45498 RepID=A0A3D8IYW1_9HELI|nr:hypothetical protein [Helicobacter cholecystus]RDU70140.1 hypothetical protein CQA62_01650 [Helicobacter cholecystus]VEJ24681.1 disulphide isomerase [Helicobacter cholecystus]